MLKFFEKKKGGHGPFKKSVTRFHVYPTPAGVLRVYELFKKNRYKVFFETSSG